MARSVALDRRNQSGALVIAERMPADAGARRSLGDGQLGIGDRGHVGSVDIGARGSIASGST